MTARRLVGAWLLAGVAVACGDTDGAAEPEHQPAAGGGAVATDAAAAEPGAELRGALAGHDVLIVLLDALHAAHLGAYGGRDDVSPTLDALAAEGVVLRRAWSQTSWTLPSTTSLFTGLYQESHGLQFSVVDDLKLLSTRRLSDDALTLAELFDAAGYDTACYTQNPWTGRSYNLDQGFDAFHEVRNDRFAEGDPAWGLAGEVAGRHAAKSAAPRFTYVHMRRPHTPFNPPEAVLRDFVDPAYDGPVVGDDHDIEQHNTGDRRMSAADAQHHLDRYHANIRQADRCVERMLSGVDRSRTLVVVLSDHGEAFGQHARYGHNWRSFEEYVHIPVLLGHPALGQGAYDAPVMTVDVLPTLVELFDLDVSGAPLPPQGHSLVPLLAAGVAPERDYVYTSARLDRRGERHMAIHDGRFKLVRQHPAGMEWLYDLQADPDERVNVLDEHPDVAAELRDALGRWYTSQRPQLVDVELGDSVDPAVLEELRRLGYLGGDDGEDG